MAKQYKKMYRPNGGFWKVPYSKGRRSVEIPIDMDAFAKNGHRGLSFECGFAVEGLSYTKAKPDVLGHPVHYFYVEKEAVWIVDKMAEGGLAFGHAIKYMHNQGHVADFFDVCDKSKFLSRFGGRTIILRLRPPKTGGRSTEHVETDPNRNRQGKGKRKPHYMTTGALRRAKNAGLRTPPKMKSEEPKIILARRTLAEIGGLPASDTV